MSFVQPEPNSGCWLWAGDVDGHGYGVYHVTRTPRKRVGAHRAVYEFYRGVIPAGLTLDHLCRNVVCVNPDHLEPVTLRVNLRRGKTVTAKNAAATHCPKGHPYDAANTHVYRGGRFCRTCPREYQRRKAAQKGQSDERCLDKHDD